ncbi:hypothetical protein BDV96DRAFT_622061 [Lophiotrema nucula]|uniref:Archaemetzincin-2 n=1 Tax=Lophiotrema nucula TaxID=690887 RepID=A0A6A5Z7L3_9PLEO|nr:hypothetical protein BDV96DRAFT_622061 [Lophiotrema nucula]
MAASTEACQHTHLQLFPSAYADEIEGYARPNPGKRMGATTKSGHPPKTPKGWGQRQAASHINHIAVKLSLTFPGPLVLPDDDLHWDPKWPPQSFRSWLDEKERNKITNERKTLYIAGVPKLDFNSLKDDRQVRSWTMPKLKSDDEDTERPAKKARLDDANDAFRSPPTQDFISYLGAFYHNLPIKSYPAPLRFLPWHSSSSKKSSKPSPLTKYLGLAIDDRVTRIRVRPCPDKTFPFQLNLNDILDAAISALPDDAYSTLFLIDHDMYEDEDDDFCCGRAYGGSRVAVVSTARYNPALDGKVGLDYAHMWPASHCKEFVDRLCAVEDLVPKPVVGTGLTDAELANAPLRKAIDAVKDLDIPKSNEELSGLWFSRLCRTVSHELGHCLGMDHCVYYACVMQGTAGMKEDVRQPPYLCPVCLAKVSYAISTELEGGDEEVKEGTFLKHQTPATWPVRLNI